MSDMKRNIWQVPALVAALGILVADVGCRQTRGNADADRNRAATPEEGGATSTAGSAGEAKNFGDTHAKQKQDGNTPSASPSGLNTDAKAGQSGGAVNPPSEKLGTGR